MSLHKLFKTDKKRERDGVYIDYGPNEDLPEGEDGRRPTMRFKIARAGGSNNEYNKAIERLTRPHRRAIQTGNFGNDQAEALFREAFIAHVLLGWEGVTGEDKAIIPYSKKAAEKLFAEMPDLLAALREEASNASLFREELRETDLGNSGGSLSTDSSKDP